MENRQPGGEDRNLLRRYIFLMVVRRWMANIWDQLINFNQRMLRNRSSEDVSNAGDLISILNVAGGNGMVSLRNESVNIEVGGGDADAASVIPIPDEEMNRAGRSDESTTSNGKNLAGRSDEENNQLDMSDEENSAPGMFDEETNEPGRSDEASGAVEEPQEKESNGQAEQEIASTSKTDDQESAEAPKTDKSGELPEAASVSPKRRNVGDGEASSEEEEAVPKKKPRKE